MTTDARLSLLVWMPGHLGFIFLSFPLRPWGLEVFHFFQMRLNRSYRIQAIKFQQLRSPQEEYTIKKTSPNHRNWHIDSLGFGIPSKGRISQGRKSELPFLVGEHTQNRVFPGLCSMPSQVTKGLHSLGGYQAKTEITQCIFLFPFVPIKLSMKYFRAVWLSQSKALLIIVAKSFWFLEWSIGWALQKQVGPFCQTKVVSHREKRKEKAVIKQETKMDKCTVWKRTLQLGAVNCIITNISWNRNTDRAGFPSLWSFCYWAGPWLQQGFYIWMLCFIFEPLTLSFLGDLGAFFKTFSPNPLIFFISSGTSLSRSQGELGTGEEWDWQEQNHCSSTEHPHSPGRAVRSCCLCSPRGIFSRSQDLTAVSTWTKNPSCGKLLITTLPGSFQRVWISSLRC